MIIGFDRGRAFHTVLSNCQYLDGSPRKNTTKFLCRENLKYQKDYVRCLGSRSLSTQREKELLDAIAASDDTVLTESAKASLEVVADPVAGISEPCVVGKIAKSGQGTIRPANFGPPYLNTSPLGWSSSLPTTRLVSFGSTTTLATNFPSGGNKPRSTRIAKTSSSLTKSRMLVNPCSSEANPKKIPRCTGK